MSPNTMKISPLAELAASSIPKIPLVSRLLKTFLMAYIDMIQERSNSNFDVKCATIQFYGNSHNSQSDLWIELKFYVVS
jgi:hypothetical protein